MKLKSLGGIMLAESSFQQQKPLLLLCYLSLEGRQSRRHLADLFWSGAIDPRDALSTTLRRLRRLDPRLIHICGEYISARLECDASALLEALDEGNHERITTLYEGPLLAGLDLSLGEELEEWVFQTREYIAARVREVYLQLAENHLLNKDYVLAGKHAETAYDLTGAPELEPEDYSRLYTALHISKSPILTRLKAEAEGYGINLRLNAHDKPAMPLPLKPTPHNLPTLATSFVGRDPELLEITALLRTSHCRLLSLHGAGGVGKTRLAIQAAWEQLGSGFHDGIFFISLDALREAKYIPVTIANTLGIQAQANRPILEQIEAFIADKNMLLILDNYEHLLGEQDHVISSLLSGCSKLKVLVSTRVRLNLTEEHVLSLEGLSVPPTASNPDESLYTDALQLFIQRAKKASVAFSLETYDLADALKICRLLEGLPLGIELAAAWVRLMSVADVAKELDYNLDFLKSTSHNQIDRHLSLRAAFQYSWNLLTDKEQEVLRKLSVFRGGFRREAAREVAGASLPVLASLVDKSMLRVLANGRYDSHPITYQFTQEQFETQLSVKLEIQERHTLYIWDLAQNMNDHLSGKEQALYLRKLAEEGDNVRAALTWTVEKGQVQLGLKLCLALIDFWKLRCHFSEARDWLKSFLVHPQASADADIYAQSLNAIGYLARHQGDFKEALCYFKTALSHARNLKNEKLIARSLGNIGVVRYFLGEVDVARSHFEENLALAQRINDKKSLAASLNNLGLCARLQSDYDSASLFHEQALAIWLLLEDFDNIAGVRNNLGIVARLSNNLDRALDLYRQSLAYWQDIENNYGVAMVMNNIGKVYLDQTKYQEAAEAFKKSLAIREALGDKSGMASALSNMGNAAMHQGRHEKARSLFFRSLQIKLEIEDKVGITNTLTSITKMVIAEEEFEKATTLLGVINSLRDWMPIEKHGDFDQSIHQIKSTLGKKTFNQAWQKGRSMSLEQSVAYALHLTQSERSTIRPTM